MDLSNFYAVVAGINFTLLGLWWVAVLELGHLRDPASRMRQVAYVVSLQFVVPGTASLLATVAPKLTAVWRISFTTAGLVGVLAIVLLLPTLRRGVTRAAASLLLFLGVPLYLLIALVAAVPPTAHVFGSQLTGLQLEAIMFCLLVLLGAQTAWAASMAQPERS